MCNVYKCDNDEILAKGLCKLHYQRQYRISNPKPKTFKKCSIDGCNNQRIARGLCRKHSHRYYRHGNPHTVKLHFSKCLVPECTRNSKSSNGYCVIHNSRFLKTGDPLLTTRDLKRKSPKPTCRAIGCHRNIEKGGYCLTHSRLVCKVSSDMSKTFEEIYGNPPYTCYLCGRVHEIWNPSELWHDHVIPLSRGGADTIENIKPTCRECNEAKKALDLQDFIDMCKRVAKVHR